MSSGETVVLTAGHLRTRSGQRVHIASAIGFGTFVHRTFQTLTDKTSFAGTTAEQIGTEEATLDNALLPQSTGVTVYAQLVGRISDWTTTSSLITRIEISFDGGSTWTAGRDLDLRTDSADAQEIFQVVVDHQVTGTVTGDIQARAMTVSAVGAADSRNYVDCAINMEVLVHP